MKRFMRLVLPIFDKLHFIMAEEEIEISSENKFERARNKFKKVRKEKELEEEENEDNLIEDVAHEEEEMEVKPKRNTRKKSQENSEEVETNTLKQEATQKTEVKKKKKPKEKINPLQPIINFIKDERVHRVFGLALILGSIYML